PHSLPSKHCQIALRSQGFHERPKERASLTTLRATCLTPRPVQEVNEGFSMLMKLQKKGRWAASLGVPVACKNMNNHRNRFIRLGLYSGMRLLLAFAFVLIPMDAMSLKDFNAKPASEQSAYLASFIDSMAGKLEAKNPQLAADIRDW